MRPVHALHIPALICAAEEDNVTEKKRCTIGRPLHLILPWGLAAAPRTGIAPLWTPRPEKLAATMLTPGGGSTSARVLPALGQASPIKQGKIKCTTMGKEQLSV